MVFGASTTAHRSITSNGQTPRPLDKTGAPPLAHASREDIMPDEGSGDETLSGGGVLPAGVTTKGANAAARTHRDNPGGG